MARYNCSFSIGSNTSCDRNSGDNFSWFKEEYGGHPIIYSIIVFHLWDVVSFGRVVHVIWYVIGFLGNLISVQIWILSRMKRYNPSALYLVAITVCDISYQIFHVFFYLKYFWGLPSLGYSGLCQIWNILNMIPQYGSQLLVLGFSAERFISIIRPFQSDKFSRIKRAPYEVGTIMIFVFVLSIPQGYFWHVNGKGSCTIRTQTAVLVFYEHWAIVTESILFLIVPITNLILNYIVLRKTSQALGHNEYLRTNSINRCKAKQNFKQNKPMTKTLLAIAFFRILTQLPMSVTYTLQNFPSLNFGPFPMPLAQMAYDPQWQRFFNYYSVRILIETFAVSHHALSFFIFYASTKQFRDELHRKLKWFSTVSFRRRNEKGPPASTRWKITSTLRRTGLSNV